MATETGRQTRTIRGYIDKLLEYPRWYIGREVDFSACRGGGHYNEFLEFCVNCRFGEACRWLDAERTPSTGDASVDELTQALEGAVLYLQSLQQSGQPITAEARVWLREARRFLGSHRA